MFVVLVYWRQRERERERERERDLRRLTEAGWPCGMPDRNVSLEPPRHCWLADIIALILEVNFQRWSVDMQGVY